MKRIIVLTLVFVMLMGGVVYARNRRPFVNAGGPPRSKGGAQLSTLFRSASGRAHITGRVTKVAFHVLAGKRGGTIAASNVWGSSEPGYGTFSLPAVFVPPRYDGWVEVSVPWGGYPVRKGDEVVLDCYGAAAGDLRFYGTFDTTASPPVMDPDFRIVIKAGR